MIEINKYHEEITKGINILNKCSACKIHKVIIHRRYSGEQLCRDCFIKSIEKNVSTTISKYKMIKSKDMIVIGVSGGKDSLTLLHNLYELRKRQYRAKEIIAVTIDEGIDGYRNKSIVFAEKLCKKYNIDHKIISFKESVGKTLDQIVREKKKSNNYQYACNYCATLRRRTLNEAARNLGANVLALGHNLTDVAETFLMNVLFKRYQIIGNQYLFKQESNNIRDFFIKKITPLMRIPEDEISLYANLKGIEYYPYHCPFRDQDPILRKRVLDFIQLCKEFSPEIEFNLFNGFIEISEVLYKNNKKKDYNLCIKCGYPCGKTETCLYCKYVEKIKN